MYKPNFNGNKPDPDDVRHSLVTISKEEYTKLLEAEYELYCLKKDNEKASQNYLVKTKEWFKRIK